MAPRKSTLPDYSLNVLEKEQILLEDELAKLEFSAVRIATTNKRIVTLTGEGVEFYKVGGFAKEHKILKAQKEAGSIKQEESDARKAAIKQGHYAEKANNLSRLAIWISVGGALISLGTVLATIV